MKKESSKSKLKRLSSSNKRIPEGLLYEKEIQNFRKTNFCYAIKNYQILILLDRLPSLCHMN